MAITPTAIVSAVEEASGGKSIRKMARELGVSKTLVERFLKGERGIEPDPLYVAIYRTYPSLRWMLEEFQRHAALSDAPEDDREEPAMSRRA